MGLVSTILNQKILSSADWGKISQNRMKIVKSIVEETLNIQDGSKLSWLNVGEGEYIASALIRREDSSLRESVTIPVIYKRGKNKSFTGTQIYLGTQGNININLSNSNVQKLYDYFSEVEKNTIDF